MTKQSHKDRKKNARKVAVKQEVEISTESSKWHENKERLLSVVLLIGKPPQALQVERYYSDNCY